MTPRFPIMHARIVSVLFLALIGWMSIEHGFVRYLGEGLIPLGAKPGDWLRGHTTARAIDHLDDRDSSLNDIRGYYDLAALSAVGRGHKVSLKGSDGWYFYYPSVLPYPKRSEGNGVFLDLFEDLDKVCRQKGFRLYILPLPDKSIVYQNNLPKSVQGLSQREDRYRRFLDDSRARGIEVLEWPGPPAGPAGVLPAAAGGPPLYLKKDSHWSEEGVELAVEIMLRRLREDYDLPVREMTWDIVERRETFDLFRRLALPRSLVDRYFSYTTRNPSLIAPRNIQPDVFVISNSLGAIFHPHTRLARAGQFYVSGRFSGGATIAMMTHTALSTIQMKEPTAPDVPMIFIFPSRMLDRYGENGYVQKQLDYALASHGLPVVADYEPGTLPVHELEPKGRLWISRSGHGFFSLKTASIPELESAEYVEFDLRFTKPSKVEVANLRVGYVTAEQGVFHVESARIGFDRGWHTWRFPLNMDGQRGSEIRIYPATRDWPFEISNIRFR